MRCGDVTTITLGLQPRLKHEFKEVALEEILSSITSHHVLCATSMQLMVYKMDTCYKNNNNNLS
jgi:hypothetical protein